MAYFNIFSAMSLLNNKIFIPEFAQKSMIVWNDPTIISMNSKAELFVILAF